MIDSTTPGQRLRTIRKQRGMTAEMLAARVGISPSAVRNQENGTNGFSVTRAAEYAEVLGVTPQWLLFGEAPPQATRPFTVRSETLPTGSGASMQRVTLDIKANVSIGVAAQLLALIEGDQP